MDDIKLLLEGTDYQRKYLDLIAKADKEIILQSYIFELDSFGSKVLELLLKKSTEGVKVFLLIDYWGSFFNVKKIKERTSNHENIKASFFNPLKLSTFLLQGRRLHHKVLLVDNKEIIVGGINVSTSRLRFKKDRLDFALMIASDFSEKFKQYFLNLGLDESTVQLKKHKEIHSSNTVFLVNDWFRSRKNINDSYLSLVDKSTERITLLHGYFLPSKKLLKKLIEKSGKGVRVELILPRISDWKVWVWSTRYLYKYLLEHKISIYEWEDSELHGKLGVFDGKVLSLGSHNLNYMSSYGNIELNCEVHDKEFVERVNVNVIDLIKKGSKQIQGSSYPVTFSSSWMRNFIFFHLLTIISFLSIMMIKFAHKVVHVHPFRLLAFIFLIILGIVGVILPILPGLIFIFFAFVVLSTEKKSTEKM